MGAFLDNLWAIVLDAAPWLVFGLIVAGLIKAWFPMDVLSRWLGGRGLRPVWRAALVGTPLPLCSCSVVPAAVTLRRGGASRGATVSFLIATPENGADSIALSYALLGPFMTIARPVAAIVSAICAGWLTDAVDAPQRDEPPRDDSTTATAADSCCGGCCHDEPAENGERRKGFLGRCIDTLRYAFFDLFDDLIGWLAVGLVLAAVMNTLVAPGALASWGSGLGAMLVMALAGVPMYICATASTPVAAAMLAAGMSPGVVLVFLLAGPATNLGTVGIVWRELGKRSAISYLAGILACSIALGLATDWLVTALGVDVHPATGQAHEILGAPIAWISVAVLIAATMATVWRRWVRPRVKLHGATMDSSSVEAAR